MYTALAGDGLANLKSLRTLHRAFTTYFEDQGSEQLQTFIKHLAKPKFEVGSRQALSRTPRNTALVQPSTIDSEETARMALALETWLLEIAPLVQENNWGYADILQIAKNKFGHEHELVLSSGQIRSRCGEVGLRLSPNAQRGGRRIKAQDLALRKSPSAHMATALKSMGENGEEWLLGNRSLCGEPISTPDSEKGNIFTRVATNDPGPERVWL